MGALESIFGCYYRRPAVKGPLVRDGANLGWKPETEQGQSTDQQRGEDPPEGWPNYGHDPDNWRNG